MGLFVSITTIVELGRFAEAGPDVSSTTPFPSITLLTFSLAHDQSFDLIPVSLALVMLLGAVLGFTQCCFGGYHLYLAMKNRYVPSDSPPNFCSV